MREPPLVRGHAERTLSPWRELPGRYGPPSAIYNRFNC